MKSYNNGKLPKFKPGQPDQLPQELDQYLNWFCYNKLMDMMLEDESIEVRANALECQTQLATSLGPNYCQKHFMETNKYIIKRLRRQNEGFKKSNQVL